MSKTTFFQLGIRKFYRGIKILRERWSGIDFTKGLSLKELGLKTDEGNIYAASATYDLRSLLEELYIQPTDSIFDFGCGKGAAMYEMSKFPFNRIGGVEINADLCRVARNNFDRLHLDNLKVFHSNAAAFTDLDNYNHFYFFNPFPRQVLIKVLHNLELSYKRVPRRMTLIYYLPAYQKYIKDHGFFKFSHTTTGKKYDASFFIKEI